MSDHFNDREAQAPAPAAAGPKGTWRPSALLKLSAGLHAAGAVALAAAPARWRWIAGTLFLNHVVLAVAGIRPRSRLLGPNLSRLPAAAATGRVALTFDDGPDPEVTPRVLDLLEAYGARASFFCIGRRAEEHPGVVADTVRRGHRLENHTYRHSNVFSLGGPRGLGREIDRAQECLERLGGRRPSYFRAPAGVRNPWLDLILTRRRLKLASWTRRGFDTLDRQPQRVARRLLAGLAAGDVLLLHDGNAARDSNQRPVVLEVLPRLLDALAENGLRGTYLPSRIDPNGVQGQA